ncbi:hypothetical protein [Vreelandella massiliensis]|uniref:hypothetical protein n=1 Tax=Vreelandella massiliensis TaxID=1816686 RepID=UPI00096A497E|nr:hypothetical protein [Halomonas massiliensis]
MNMTERLAASRAKINAMKEQLPDKPVIELPTGWVHIGERNGKPHYRTTPGVTVPKPKRNPVADLLDRLPKERGHHKVGSTCPHCLGSGRYSAHRGHFHNEKCYRCDGKGLLDAKDLAYLKRREVNQEPICKVVTA